jgi:hypothetical protein
MIWKIYFWILIVVSILGALGVAAEVLGLAEPHPIYPRADYPIWLVNCVQIVGLYGYSYRRPVLSERFWQFAFAVFGLNFIATIWIATVRFAAAADVHIVSALVPILLFGLMIGLPNLVANRRYAFRSPGIWQTVQS